MTANTDMFTEAIVKILSHQCEPHEVRLIEAGGSAKDLWGAVERAGFLDLLIPEEDGGAALPMHQFFPVLAALGRFAVPLPLAQTLVARAILPKELREAGIVTIADALHMHRDHTADARVPYALVADSVLVQQGAHYRLLPTGSARRELTGVRGDLSARLWWQEGEGSIGPIDLGKTSLLAINAACHAAMLSGAMARVLEMTLSFCNEREQFGRPIGKFQAVQQQVSVMAEHAAAASVAAAAAFDVDGLWPSVQGAAIAKARASEAAYVVASIAHALHGAIGMTEELDLQIWTRRLHAWRIAHGADGYWNKVVAMLLLEGSLSFTRGAHPH